MDTPNTDERSAMFRAEMEARAVKLAGWLDLMYEAYADLVSRPTETAAVSGFNPEPQRRPCEHRRQWQRGGLCLACENTGWRSIVSGEEGIDPYSVGAKRGGFTIRESDSARRAREARQRDAVIARLEYDERIRDGLEAAEDAAMRNFRLATQLRVPRKLLRALALLEARRPDLYVLLRRRNQTALIALAVLVPGRIPPPPG